MKPTHVGVPVFRLSLWMTATFLCVIPAALHADQRNATVQAQKNLAATSSVTPVATTPCDCSKAGQALGPTPTNPVHDSSDRGGTMVFSLAQVEESQGERMKAQRAAVVSKRTASRERIPKTSVFPTTPLEVYTIYTNLAIFWVVLIGLLVIIKMKLAEIERIQKLGIDKQDINAPLLY